MIGYYFFTKKHGDCKERVLNSYGCLHGKIYVLNKINIKIADQLFEDLNVYYSERKTSKGALFAGKGDEFKRN